MVDITEVRHLTKKMQHASSFTLAEEILVQLSSLIELPVIAWSPDVCDPNYNEHMDAFMLRNGWPQETQSLWWNHAVMLRHPVYLNCRINALPFIVDMTDAALSELADVRKVNKDAIERNAQSSIVVPIRLPRGQIAMLFFGGVLDNQATRELLDSIQTELIAIGLYFMQVFIREHGKEMHDEKLLSILTPKQWECLRLSAQGFRESEISEIMGIVTPTVRYHLKNATTNIGASTRPHAIAIASQLGMLGPISI